MITPGEWQKITEGGDGSTITYPANVNWLVNTIADRLVDLTKSMNLGEFYLTINSYGLVYMDGDRVKSVSMDFHISDKGGFITRQRKWKPLKIIS